MGPRVSVFRISRSRVPGNKSIVIMGCLFPIHLTPSENCATAREDSAEEVPSDYRWEEYLSPSIDCQGENSLTPVAGSSRRHVQSVSTNEAEIQAPTCCLSEQWPSPQDTTQPDSSNVPAALGRFQSRCIRPYTSRA